MKQKIRIKINISRGCNSTFYNIDVDVGKETISMGVLIYGYKSMEDTEKIIIDYLIESFSFRKEIERQVRCNLIVANIAE